MNSSSERRCAATLVCTLIISLLVAAASSAMAETLYVDGINGSDDNTGTSERPLKSLRRATELVSAGSDSVGSTIKILPGLYILDDKVEFDGHRTYTQKNRLTIEADILPDDSAWEPRLMPTIMSVAQPGENFGFDCAVGLDIEVDHVTIRGLEFLGNPLPVSYYYPIGRQGMGMEDLQVTQCLFIGAEDALPIQSGILAHGHGIAVDHCIFYQCRNSVVYYFISAEDRTVPRHGSSMTYCIVDGSYESGIWVASPDEVFEFHHNIITRCEWAWIHNRQNTVQYPLSNSIMTGNRHLIGKFLATYEAGTSDLTYVMQNVIVDGEIALVKKVDVELPGDYLHVVPGTLGSELGAGLHMAPRE
jgi:hypothetical protein